MAQEGAVLRDRRTIVTLNAPRRQIVQPYVALERSASSMATEEHEDITDCVLVPGVGWQIEPVNDHRKGLYESKKGLAGLIKSGDVQKVTSLVEHGVMREFLPTGVSGTADAAVAADNAGYTKRVVAEATWDDKFDADLTAVPVPDEGDSDEEDLYPLDRVLITNKNHDPREPLYFAFWMDGISNENLSTICGITFNGPAGKGVSKPGGIGFYYLKFLGDGTCILYEATAASLASSVTTWLRRATFKYGSHRIAHVYRIKIETDARFDTQTSRWVGSKIVLSGDGGADVEGGKMPEEGGGGFFNELRGLREGISQGLSAGRRRASSVIYNVPRGGEADTTLHTIRVDVRRNVRLTFQLQDAVFPLTATLRDDVFTIPLWTTADGKITLEWYGDIPPGTAIDVKLHKASDDLELATPIVTITDEHSGQKTYDSPDQERKFYAVATLTTASDKRTPTLTSIKIFRDALTEEPTRTAIVIPLGPNELAQVDVTAVTATGATQDAASENAVVELYDYSNKLGTLRKQSLQPIKIETEYNAVPDKTTLFQGYVREARYTKKGHSRTQVYPDKTHGTHSVTMMGEWRRLVETLAPQRYIWRDGSAFGLPQKVDVVIETLIGAAGYDPSEIDTPGSELRLWGKSGSYFLMDAVTPVADFIQEIVRDFYAGHLLFDASAGATGMWRVLPQKLAPYNILARFETDTAADVKTRVSGAHSDKIVDSVSEAYGTAVTTSPLGNSQNTIRTYIQRKSFVQWVEPPEGNLVYVAGMASGLEDSDSGRPSLIDQLFINTDSYNPFNLAPAHAKYPDVEGEDYIGRAVPIHYYDPKLPNQEAVTFTARRIFDYSCHARKHLNFRAPLILITDADDAQQQRPRPLRYYDIVEVYNDETSTYDEYIVESVNIQYTHDREQMAHYHLVRSSIMATRAANSNSLAKRPYFIDGKLQNRSMGKATAVTGRWMALQQEWFNALSDVVQLPNPFEFVPDAFEPPQNIDILSADYGKFAFVEGVDNFL